MPTPSSIALPSCLLAALGLPLAAQNLTETIYPKDAPVQRGTEVFHACRVVDAITGKPIVGAELLLVDESRTPVAGRFWSKRIARSDAAGFVHVRVDDLVRKRRRVSAEEEKKREEQVPDAPIWLMLRAPGYGPSTSSTAVPSLVWALSPAVDLPIQLRNWQDLPVAKAKVGFCVGCGHTPDVANATTDAQGHAVLHGVDPNNHIGDIYPEAEGLAITEYGRADWAPGDLPVVVRAALGFPVRGKVVDVDGKPVAGAFVGVMEVHRGPWSETGPDGGFALSEGNKGNDLFVFLGDREIHFERPLTDQPYVLQLPKQGERRRQLVEVPEQPSAPLASVKLRLLGKDDQPVEQLEIVVEGPLPLHRLSEESVADGMTEFQRLAGKYDVFSKGEGFERRIGTIELAAEKQNEVTLHATPLAQLSVRAEDMAELGSIYLRTADGSREITELFAADGTATVPVPNKEPFCFVVGSENGVRVVRVNLAEAQQQSPFVLQAFAPTHVRGQIVGEDGKPVAAAVALVSRWECLRSENLFDLRKLDLVETEEGRFELDSKNVGLTFLAVVPFDLGLRPRLLAASLPYRGVDVQIDLGRLTLSAQPALRLLGADGKPLAKAEVSLTRVGWHDVRERGPAFATDDDGGYLGPDPRAGDAIVVPAAAWDIEPDTVEGQDTIVDVPFRTVLGGTPPWTIQVPAGELLVDIHDKHGQPVRARVFVNDRTVLVAGKTLLRQLQPGKLDLVITAVDRKTMFATVDVPATGRGTFAAELPE